MFKCKQLAIHDLKGPGYRFTNISLKLYYERQPYLRYVKSYGRCACLNIWKKLRQFSYGEPLFP